MKEVNMVLDKAHELGLALSESEEFNEMLRLRSELEMDTQLQKAITDFSDTQQALMTVLSDPDADQLETQKLSNDLEHMQGELMAHPIFSAMLEAQNAFETLMKQVNGVIGSYIGGGEPDDEEDCGCGGGCSHNCESCKH